MQSLVQIQAVQEGRDAYMLQYLLQRQDMLSMTGYKVLQGQEAAGLIPCYRVVYDVWDKLNYDVEQYQDLACMLPGLAPGHFLNYVRNILSVILNMKNIGFLHPYNLETTLDKIFIDKTDDSVHMVYLPIAEYFLDCMNKHYEQTLKSGLVKAIQEHAGLQTEEIRPLFILLTNASSTLEQIYASLPGLAPPPRQAANVPHTGTAALSRTGGLSVSERLSSGSLSRTAPAPGPAPAEPQPVPDTAAEQGARMGRGRRKMPGRGLFGKKAAAALSEQDTGGTEVLSMFVPCIYLKGQGKAEFLVDKREYVVGREAGADGVIDSAAVSRKHCRITNIDGRSYVTDLGSANGTYLNGGKLEPDKPRPVNEGDRLKFGNMGFTVMGV